MERSARNGCAGRTSCGGELRATAVCQPPLLT